MSTPTITNAPRPFGPRVRPAAANRRSEASRPTISPPLRYSVFTIARSPAATAPEPACGPGPGGGEPPAEAAVWEDGPAREPPAGGEASLLRLTMHGIITGAAGAEVDR